MTNHRFGTAYTLDQMTHWDTHTVIDPKHANYMWAEALQDPETTILTKPLPHAVETVKALLAQGHRVTVVSDRSEKLFDATRLWVHTLVSPDVPVVLTRNPNVNNKKKAGRLTKSQVAYLHKLNWVIEDAPHHGELLAGRAYIDGVYLLDKPYNRDVAHDKLTRVGSWADIWEKEIA